MISIDGRMGEGGGQVLRTSLAAAILTGQPVRLDNIRGGRRKSGLLHQHLTCVRAAVAISGGHAEGAQLRSHELTFSPDHVRGGNYRFDVGTAGSANLVLQTVLPPLLMADEPSTVVITGGTHNPSAPPTDYLQHCFLPVLERMGGQVSVKLDQYGFFPAGGGKLRVRIEPSALHPVAILERAEPSPIEVIAIRSHLDEHVSKREIATACRALQISKRHGRDLDVPRPRGPGNALLIRVPGFQATAFGRKGKRAESVAQEAVDEFLAWRKADVPVGEHLADQLLFPMVLAGGGSFRTVEPSLHTRTNAEVLGKFLDVPIRFVEEGTRGHVVRVG